MINLNEEQHKNSEMDQEIAHYIINYFSHLLTTKEKLAIKHTRSTLKLDYSGNHKATLTRIYRKKGWLSEDQEVLDLLKGGYANFERMVAERILEEHKNGVYLNKCPRCQKLARTPQARQCRYCGHDWHHLTVAQFKLASSFQLTNGYFYLAGEITKGELSIGHYIDLTMLGLNAKPKIESIEFVLKKSNGKPQEDTALGTHDLNENQKKFLKQKGAFGTPFDIVKEI